MDLFKEFGAKHPAAAAAPIPTFDFGTIFAGALGRLAPEVGCHPENGFRRCNSRHVSDQPRGLGRQPAAHKPALFRELVLDFYGANHFPQKGHRSAAGRRLPTPPQSPPDDLLVEKVPR